MAQLTQIFAEKVRKSKDRSLAARRLCQLRAMGLDEVFGRVRPTWPVGVANSHGRMVVVTNEGAM